MVGLPDLVPTLISFPEDVNTCLLTTLFHYKKMTRVSKRANNSDMNTSKFNRLLNLFPLRSPFYTPLAVLAAGVHHSAMACHCAVTKSGPAQGYVPTPGRLFCDPMDCSPPGFSLRGTSQARILEWVAVSFSRGSSQARDQTCVSCFGRRILYH